MGTFDDLIPAARRRGAFDDLIPAGPAGASGPGAASDPEADLVASIMADAPPRIHYPGDPSGVTGTADPQGLVGGATFDVRGIREGMQIAETAPQVVQRGGAPLGQRAYASFLNTPQALELFLSRTYGPENEGWYRLSDPFGNPTGRIVVRGEDGTERLFNPPGVDFGDVVSAAGSVPDFVGAMAGGAASIPAYALGPWTGIAASAGLSALGAQAVGEPIGRLFPENRDAEPSIASDVLPRAAGELTSDALVGLIMGPAARFANAVRNKVAAPFAESASDPLAREFRGTAERMRAQGYDVSPLASEEGAGGFVPRMEGMLEKLPGSAEAMRQYRQRGDEAVARFQRDLVGDADAPNAGRRAVGEIEGQRDRLAAERDWTLGGVDQRLSEAQDAITARQGPRMGAEDAGAQTRAGLERARAEFQGEARRLYDAARAAPGGREPIVETAPVKAVVERIRRDLPPTAEGGPATEFAPEGLNRLMGGVDDIAPRITIDQARRMRSIVDDALSDKSLLPGVPEHYLGQLSRALTQTIEGSVERAGSPQLRETLQAANRFYAENVDQFSRRGVAEIYRPPTSPGYVESEQIVQRLLSGRGRPGLIRDMKATMGEDSAEWAATRRNAIEQILDTGRNRTLYGRRVVDADGLVDRLNRLDDETVRELFGVADAQQLRALAVDVSNRTRYLDAAALSPEGSPDILAQLRRAADIEDRLARDYRNDVVAPFLRGETGAAARMNADELVPYLYRRAAPDEIAQIVGKLPPRLQEEVRRGAMADIIETAISRGTDGVAGVRRLITGEGGPGSADTIAGVLGAGGDVAARQQAARIEALLPAESRRALQDLAVLVARRQERDATTSAIGGLAAGAAITGIMTAPARAAQAAVVARGLAALVTSPGFRRWVTNTTRRDLDPERQAFTVASSPYAVQGVAALAAENADVRAALEWLAGGESQLDDLGRRVTRPPGGAGSWEEYFAGRTGAPEAGGRAASAGAEEPDLVDLIMGGGR